MNGALVLDSEGLSKAVLRDREAQDWLRAAQRQDVPVIVAAATLVETIHPKINHSALNWTLSRMRVAPVTEDIARHAAQLLGRAMLHGHKYAIDAIVCATALAQPGPVTILTSDLEDIEALTGDQRRVIARPI